jgi:hypothetical protein
MQRGVMQHLDGNRLLVLRVVALAPVHGAHAAVPENGLDTIGADARPEQPVLVFNQQRFRRLADGGSQRILGSLVGCQQRLHGFAQIRVVAAGARQPGLALDGPGVGDFFEQRLDFLPARARDHEERLEPISFSNQARARRISRCTVAVEAPTASAICS